MNRKAPLPGQGGRGARERQSVWCCGRSYQRWRFVGGEFPGTHHELCPHCLQPLRWPETFARALSKLEKRERRKAIELAAYHRRAVKAELAGLTRHGTKPHGGHGRVTRTPLDLAWQAERAAMGEIEVPEITATKLRY